MTYKISSFYNGKWYVIARSSADSAAEAAERYWSLMAKQDANCTMHKAIKVE